MKLQIKKLFLVRRGTHELKSYDFEPGKLNIIVGQGARGKTTVWSIIDYVCCARESDIDSNIANAVEWVGIEVLAPLGNYVIARELKDDLEAQSQNYYLKHLEVGETEIDGLEIVPNSNGSSVKGLLDRICGIEVMTSLADENGQKISFSIRYLLNIVGQDYRTVADQQHLFAFKAPQQWQTLTKYFVSIIGVEADNLNLLRAEKQKTEKQLKKFKEEYRRALTVSENWKHDLADQLLEAKKLTMIPADVEVPKEVEKSLALVKSIIKEARRKPTLSYNVDLLGDLADKVSKNEERKAGLEFEIDQLQVRIEELEELEYVKVKFLKNQDTSWGQVNSYTNPDGDTFVQLTFTNSMITFCTDRFIEIELITEAEKGLKIPQSSIIQKEFYIVPKEYVTQSGENGREGVLRETYTEDGKATTEFIETTIYNATETEYYLDDSQLRSGDDIIKPDSTEKFTISKKGSLVGVYNINKGYADFKQIDILYENDEYAIVKSNTQYGLSVYDYIALDASSVEENEIINE